MHENGYINKPMFDPVVLEIAFDIFINKTYCAHIIWGQHGKCIKTSTNMPMFGPVVLEVTCCMLKKNKNKTSSSLPFEVSVANSKEDYPYSTIHKYLPQEFHREHHATVWCKIHRRFVSWFLMPL